MPRETFSNPDAVPAPSPEYYRGWREGYAQRLAEENSGVTPRQRLSEPVVAAGAEDWTEDSPASFRPEAPSLHDLHNRVNAHSALIRAARAYAQEEFEKLHNTIHNHTQSINNLNLRLNHLADAQEKFEDLRDAIRNHTEDIDRLDERVDEAKRSCERLEELRAGDVAAINEQLNQIYTALALVLVETPPSR